MLPRSRACIVLFVCSLMLTIPAAAQFQTPTLDGIVSGDEYANTLGDWSMTWNDSWLYIAKTNLTAGRSVVIYLDIDPLPTPISGTSANGNRIGLGDLWAGATGPFQPKLPFAADVRYLAGSANLQVRDNGGGWAHISSPGGDVTTNGTTQEFRIAWSQLPGGSRPASFRWLGFELEDAGSLTKMQNPFPAANPSNLSGTVTLPYFHLVGNTADGSSSSPFTARYSSWHVTDSDTLETAIAGANSDMDSLRRFISFDVSSAISVSSTLTPITTKTTVDGTSDPNYTGTPVVALTGPGGMTSVSGLGFDACTSCEVLGLSLSGFDRGIVGNNTSFLKIGTLTAGNHIFDNQTGVYTDQTYGGLEIRGNQIYENAVAGLDLGGAAIQATPTVNLALLSGAGAISLVTSASSPGASVQFDLYEADPSDLTKPQPKLLRATSPCFNSGTVDKVLWNTDTGFSLDTDLVLMVTGFSDSGCTQAALGTSEPAAVFSPVEKAPTTTVVNASPGLGVVGQNITFTATVSSDYSGLTGTVEFSIAGVPITGCEEVTLSSNAAQCITSFSTSGTRIVKGTYSGDSTHLTSNGVLHYLANAATTMTSLSGPSVGWTGGSLPFIATITSDVGNIGGTVTFTDNNVPIAGCEAVTVSNGEAECPAAFATDGSHPVRATYNGDTSHIGSFSTIVTVTTTTHVFTGPGDFGDSTKWSLETLPAAGENMIINGACTIDTASDTVYGNAHLNANATLIFGTSTRSISLESITGDGSNAIDMTDGGHFKFRGTFDAADITLIRGSGTVTLLGTSQPVPLLEYSILTIANGASATMASGTITVHTNFNVYGTISCSGGTLDMRGLFNIYGGTAQFANVTVPSGASVTTSSAGAGFSASGTFTVDGTFTPAANNDFQVSTLTGTGKVVVTRVGSQSFTQQFAINTFLLTNLTIEFAGAGAQHWASIGFSQYGPVIINNPNGVDVSSIEMGPTATLTLAAGVVGTGSGSIRITNPSPSAVVSSGGWIGLSPLIRLIAAGTNTYAFPIGTSTVATPVTMTFTNTGAAMPVQLQIVTGEHPQVGTSGLNAAHNLNYYLRLFNLVSGTADLTMTYSGLLDAGSSPATFALRKFASGTWSDVPASPAAGSISAYSMPLVFNESSVLIAGNPSIDHYDVSAPTSPQTVGTAFTTTVTARDKFNVLVADENLVPVTLAGTGLAFDANGDGTFGDRVKTLTGGSFTIATKAASTGLLTIGATDGNGRTGSTTVGVPASTSTAVTSSSNPSLAGQSVTFTATITTSGLGALAGTVTFKDGAASLGSGSVSGGVATFTTSALAVGAHAITAEFSGSSGFDASVSAPLTQTVAIGTPAFMTATANGTDSVALSWGAVGAATAYEIYRNNALLTSAGTNAFTDSAVTAATSYVYRVRAIVGGTPGPFSASDAATTIVFTDSSLTGAIVQAVHVTEMRSAVNAMRVAAGLPSATFSSDAVIRAADITALRTSLDQARAALGLTTLTYTDPTITPGATVVKAAHTLEIRAGTQ